MFDAGPRATRQHTFRSITASIADKGLADVGGQQSRPQTWMLANRVQ